MILIIPVLVMDNDGDFKFLVIMIVGILVISLLINAFLASDPRSLSAPPIRMQGYVTGNGDPVSGYYIASAFSAPNPADSGSFQASK
jgi:hypothetical protein